MKARGSCLCEEIQFEISDSLGVFQYCHCNRCRKFTGSAFSANIIVSPNQFKWLEGEEYLGRYEVENAKHFATTFCVKCGSSLPWFSQSNRVVVVPAGSLNDDPEIRPFQNIYYDSRATWYQDASKLIKHSKYPTKIT